MPRPYYAAAGIELWHGDALACPEVWQAADVLATDPPYGIAYKSGSRTATAHDRIAGDRDTSARDRALQLWGDRPAAVFGAWQIPRPAATRQLLIWHKAGNGPGMGDLRLPWGTTHEEIYILGDGWAGPREGSVIVSTECRSNPYGPASRLGHPTPKPVGLMVRILEKAPAGTIADPFAGVGATLLAARQLGRAAVGVEISEPYCETLARRLEQGDLFAE